MVVEAECKAGMSVHFLDGTDDPQCDDTFAENVKCEVLGLLDQEQDVNGPEALVWTTVEYKPCFSHQAMGYGGTTRLVYFDISP